MASDYDLVKTLRHIVDTDMKRESSGALCKCLDMYIMLLSKIDENPTDTKYQQIKKSSKLVASSMGAVSGGMDLLFKIGWKIQVKDFEEWVVWKGDIADLRSALTWAREKLKTLREKEAKAAHSADKAQKEEAEYLENLKKAVDMERKERYHQ
jgi:hypothetical protein